MSGGDCPHPLKVRYATEEDARAVIMFNRRVRGSIGSRRRKHERRAYECVCGAWHLTSKPGPPTTPPSPSRKATDQ